MVESIVKLQRKRLSQASASASDQALSRTIPEREPLRPPPATYLPYAKIESQAASAAITIDKPFNTRPGLLDPEKGLLERHSRHSHSLRYNHSRVTYHEDDGDDGDDGDDDGPKQHTVWILIYLSALSPIVALPVALYVLLMGTLLLLLFPLCFCLKQSPICARFRHFLSPPLVFQLALVYSSHDKNDSVRSKTSDIMVLVLVSMLSPLYAMAIAVATWVAGAFWLYTAILGNPDGREDRDDGREAVLAVRRWWEWWLIQSLKPEDHSTLRDNGSESGC